MVFGESTTREDVYQKRKPIADREVGRFSAALEKEVEVVWPAAREIRGKKDALAAVESLRSSGIDAVVLFLPIFVAPALVAHTANLLDKPFALACNEAPDSLSQLVFLAAAGSIEQIGLSCFRLPGDAASSPETMKELLSFLRAAAVKVRLQGETFGCIGGRALGISPGQADLALWEKIFKVDIEHIDQFEIAQRAERQPAAEVAKHVEWLRRNLGRVAFNQDNFTPAHLEKQVRSYLATREICHQYELDFLGVKCQPELSNGYCLQCVNVSLCNDPYDADGAKKAVPCSCEADADGALTMRILQLVSGGKPVNLNDIAAFTSTEMTMANCGAMATRFAGFSDEPEENLRHVELVPHTFGKAGGASVQFTVPAGRTMTFARLSRRESRYALGVFTGTTTMKDRNAQGATIRVRPLIFVDVDIDRRSFLSSYGSNHVHAVEGDVKEELRMLSWLYDIAFVDYDRGGRQEWNQESKADEK
jgi:L-fucose isomerase